MLLSGAALLGLSYAYAIATSSALLVLAAVQFSGVRALFLGRGNPGGFTSHYLRGHGS